MAILWVVMILNVISKYLADRYLNNNALIKARIGNRYRFNSMCIHLFFN